MELLNERWVLHIIHSLLSGKKRFNALSRDNHINPRTLTERLRFLEENGIISRMVVSSMPPNVEYELTEKGLALNSVVVALADWGRDWMPNPS